VFDRTGRLWATMHFSGYRDSAEPLANVGRFACMRPYEVKGSHVAQARVVVDERLGAGAFVRLARVAGGDARWESLTISDWYDVFVLQRVLEVVAAETGSSVQVLATEVGRHNALSDLQGIYRMFLRIAQPVRMLYFTPQLWRNYVRFGDASAAQNELGSFLAIVANVPETLIAWVEGSSLGFIPTGIELAGGTIARAWISEVVPAGAASSVKLSVTYRMG
jgi:hypothetical protein